MLKAMFKKIGKSKKGFTLIELLVVIAILGILAAILVPVVSGYITSSKAGVAKADARAVYSAACTVIAQHPDTPYDTYTDSDRVATTPATTMCSDDLAPYLGSHSFHISITIDATSHNITSVTVTEDHGASGTYTKS